MNDKNFLVNLIKRSIKERWCVRTNCTTCNASRFKTELFRYLNDTQTNAIKMQAKMHSSDFEILVKSLREVTPITPDETYDFMPAVRLVLYLLWLTDRSAEMTNTMKGALEGTFACEVLHQMQEHYRELEKRRLKQKLTQDPQHVAKLRAEKKAARQRNHAQRLLTQKIKKQEFLNMKRSKI